MRQAFQDRKLSYYLLSKWLPERHVATAIIAVAVISPDYPERFFAIALVLSLSKLVARRDGPISGSESIHHWS